MWPEDDQSQDNTKQCNDKTSIQMDGFGHTNLFSIHTHLDLSFIHCLNVEKLGRSYKKTNKKPNLHQCRKNSEIEFPYIVELPYSISICSSQPLFFILVHRKLSKMLLLPKQQHAKIPS